MRESQPIDVDYGRYLVLEVEGEFPELSAETAATDDLIKPADNGGAIIETRTFSGRVNITVNIFDTPPEPVDEHQWERIEEVVLTSRYGSVRVAELDGNAWFTPLAVKPGTRYRIRVAARGLKEMEEIGTVIDFDDEPIESHLVQLWPEKT